MQSRNEHPPLGKGADRDRRRMNMVGGSGQKRVAKMWTVPLILSLVFCLAVTAEAGMVYGRVYGADDVFRPGDTFALLKKDKLVMEVKTDESRGYSIIIDPGIYRVQFRKGGAIWEAWIQSFSGPARQDIHLKRK